VDEFDESQIFPGGIPVLGAYPVAYRSYSKDHPDTSVPLTQCLPIKDRDGDNANSSGDFHTVMRYTGKSFTAEASSLLFFTFDYGFTTFTGTPDKWKDGWSDGIFKGNDYEGSGNMDSCAVPIPESQRPDNRYFIKPAEL
jgi:hypothetical protein